MSFRPSLYLVLFCIPIVLKSQVSTTTIDLKADEQYITQVEIAKGSLPLKKIEEIANSEQVLFEPVPTSTPPPTGEGKTFWLRFRLVNPGEQAIKRLLEFGPWTNIQVYQQQPGEQGWTRKQSGHLIPYRQRDYAWANANLVELDLEPGAALTCYVQLTTSLNYFLKPTSFSIKLWSPEGFATHTSRTLMILSFFLGIYLIMLAYNLFIYLSTRERYYIPYLIILLVMSVILAHNSGFTISLLAFWPAYVHWHSLMEMVLSQVLGISIFIFTLWFLDVKNRFPGWYRFIQIYIGLVILLPLPTLFGQALLNADLSGILGILAMIIVNTLAIRSWIQGYPSANFFTLGYGAFTVGIMVTLAAELGVLSRDILQFFPINVGSAIELTFFSFALSNRINVLAQENERKKQEIIRQLQMNEELQTKVNRELEEKVRERTLEIQQQKEEIEEKSTELHLEKEKTEALLLNILPAATVLELKEKGKATPRYYKQVSVLFTDFKDFTQIVSGMPPQEIIQELNECFLAFDEIIERNHLEKIKTIGDSYMCAGGIPIPNDSHPVEAIQAAIEMRDFVEQWNQKKLGAGLKPWEMRIGIHTGELIAGVVGKKKFAFDIWGDAVNTASRIESSSEPGMINVSEQTYQLAKDQFQFTYRGQIFAKNKGEIGMYFVEPLHKVSSLFSNHTSPHPNESF